MVIGNEIRLCKCGCGFPVARGSDHRFRLYVKGHGGRGPEHYNWRGGRGLSRGYPVVWNPEHPRATRRGYVYEHLLVAEKSLGRVIPRDVEVHHVNGNTTDNSPTNLVLCENHKYHALLHLRTRALRDCGDANKVKCVFCKQYDERNNVKTWGRGCFHHVACHAEYDRKRRVASYAHAFDYLKQRLGKV